MSEEWPDQQETIADMLDGQPFPYIVIIGAGQDENSIFLNTQYNIDDHNYRLAFIEKLKDLIEVLDY